VLAMAVEIIGHKAHTLVGWLPGPGLLGDADLDDDMCWPWLLKNSCTRLLERLPILPFTVTPVASL
jgi:hypothetical protein